MSEDPRDGDDDALFELVYDELRRLARRELRARPFAASLDTTALVHEAWLKMRGSDAEALTRPRYLALAAVAMRHVFFNYVRDRRAAKRGGDWQRVTLSGVRGVSPEDDGAAIEHLSDVLEELRELNERHARIAEMRLLSGMSVPECAEVLEVSESTIDREWRAARAWIGASLERLS